MVNIEHIYSQWVKKIHSFCNMIIVVIVDKNSQVRIGIIGSGDVVSERFLEAAKDNKRCMPVTWTVYDPTAYDLIKGLFGGKTYQIGRTASKMRIKNMCKKMKSLMQPRTKVRGFLVDFILNLPIRPMDKSMAFLKMSKIINYVPFRFFLNIFFWNLYTEIYFEPGAVK